MEHGKFIRQNGGFVYDAAALAIFAAFTTPPSAARKDIINTLVVSLKSAGIWTKLDTLWLTAAADSQAATINWVNPATFTLLPVNAPTFTADRGYTGNGSNARVRTQYTPSTNGVNFTQNNGSMWAWSLTESTNASYDIGNATVAPLSTINFRGTTNNQQGIINRGGTALAAANGTSIGMFGAQITASNANANIFNGVAVSTGSTASTGLATQEQWLCGSNASNFSARQIAFAAYGASLAGFELSFYTAVRTYLQAVGAT